MSDQWICNNTKWGKIYRCDVGFRKGIIEALYCIADPGGVDIVGEFTTDERRELIALIESLSIALVGKTPDDHLKNC